MLSHFLRAASVSSLSFVAGVGVDAATITIPATANAGDIAIYWDAPAQNGNFIPDSTITGWTRVINDYTTVAGGGTGSSQRQQVFIRILQTGDAGTTVPGYNGGSTVGARRKIMLVFRGNIPIKTYSFNNYTFEFTTGTPTNKTISTSLAAIPAVAIGMYRAGAVIPSFTFTPTQDGIQNGGSNAAVMYYKTYNSSPSNITIGMTDNSALNYLAGFYLSVT
jgi:hypothetical protein